MICQNYFPVRRELNGLLVRYIGKNKMEFKNREIVAIATPSKTGYFVVGSGGHGAFITTSQFVTMQDEVCKEVKILYDAMRVHKDSFKEERKKRGCYCIAQIIYDYLHYSAGKNKITFNVLVNIVKTVIYIVDINDTPEFLTNKIITKLINANY